MNPIDKASKDFAEKLNRKIEVSRLADEYAVLKVKTHYEYLYAWDELNALRREIGEARV
jgi:hypothetical protein